MFEWGGICWLVRVMSRFVHLGSGLRNLAEAGAGGGAGEEGRLMGVEIRRRLASGADGLVGGWMRTWTLSGVGPCGASFRVEVRWKEGVEKVVM